MTGLCLEHHVCEQVYDTSLGNDSEVEDDDNFLHRALIATRLVHRLTMLSVQNA